MRTGTAKTLSLAFQTDKPIVAYGALAATSETYGFDAVSVYNDMLYQPAWLPLMEMARTTDRIRVGVAAVNPFTCHPINIAGQIALIDEMAGGRAYLGMARGGWLDFIGLRPDRPIQALREAFGCVRHLLSGSSDPLPGEIFPLAGGDALRWKIERPDIPFLLGTWGRKTIHACAELVSEVKIGGSANPDIVPHYVKMLAESAAGSGAPRADVVLGAVTVVDEDGDAARARARREVALYLPLIADLDPTVKIDPALHARLCQAADAYDFEGAAALISDELLSRFAFAGRPDDVAQQAADIFAAGGSRVEFGTPHGLTTESGVSLLGSRVIPALQGIV